MKLECRCLSENRRRGSLALPFALALGASPFAFAALLGDWFVDASAASCAAGNGSAAAPFCTISEAIDAAADGDTVHIAPGTYIEQLIVDKDLALIGTEGDDVTIVQGPGGRVVRPWNGTSVVIDGLTITGGNGFSKATGLFVGNFPDPPTVTLTNSTVTGNRSDPQDFALGGGVYLGSGTLTISNSTVSDNTASAERAYGGGICVRRGLLTVESSIIEDNNASGSFFDDGGLPPPSTYGFGGGVACVIGGQAILRNTTIVGNSARGDYDAGGAVAAYSGPVTLDHCTVSANRGGSALVDRSSLTVRNSVVWGNSGAAIVGFATKVQYSDVEGGWNGPGNLALDPGFVDPSSGDWSLSAGSPCIDAADPSETPVGLDLGGNPRFLDGDLDRAMRSDMGAYEFENVRLSVSGAPTPGGVLTVDVGGTAGMSLILAGGFAQGETLFAPWGSIFFDLGAPFRRFAFGTSPTTGSLPIPPTVVGPLDVVLQAFGSTSLRSGKSAGNFSNPVFLTIE